MAQTAEVQGLYQAEAPVVGQERKERRAAMGAALRQVLIKVSGLRRVVQHPDIVQAIKQPAGYLQQYRYRYRSLPPEPELPEMEPVSRQLLWAYFDPAAVNRLLRDAGLPVWGKARPSTLFWLAIEEQGQARLLAAGVEPMAELVLNRADQRAVPLILPLWDLEDQGSLVVSDVWGGFDETILKASTRYRSDSVLVAKAYSQGTGFWEARWTLLSEEGGVRWATQGELLEIVLEEGIDQAADLLAKRFAVTASSQDAGLLELVVEGIDGIGDYARVDAYLNSLDSVDKARVIRLEAGRAKFLLESRVDREALGRSIALGRTLAPLGSDSEWLFQLQP